MAFCMNCGAKLEDHMKFCPNCGAPVEEIPQAPEVAPAPEAAPQPAPEENLQTPQTAPEENLQTPQTPPSASALDKVRPAVENAVGKVRPAVDSAVEKIRPAVEGAVEKARPAVESAVAKIRPAVESAVEKVRPAVGNAVEKARPTVKAAVEKVRPVVKRHYKVIGAAALAVVIILLLLSRCTGGTGGTGGGKDTKYLEPFLGYWSHSVLYGALGSGATVNISSPDYIAVTEDALQLEPRGGTIPMSQVEYKDGALYFTAEWYESYRRNNLPSGIETYELRLVYDKSEDLMDLEVYTESGVTYFGEIELAYDTGWYALKGYKQSK